MGDAYDELGVTHLECGLRYLKDVIASKVSLMLLGFERAEILIC